MFRRQPPPVSVADALTRALVKSVMFTATFALTLFAYRVFAPVLGLSYVS